MPNSRLYHYCSAEAMLEIVKHKKIWLSSLIDSNDHKEGRIIFDKVIDLAKVDSIPKAQATTITETLELLHKNHPAFAFCLSKRGDLLSQWRGYADDGMGFCIEFSSDGLNQVCRMNQDMNLKLVDVNYVKDQDDPNLRKAAEDLLNRLLDLMKHNGSPNAQYAAELIGYVYTDQVKNFFYKHRGFLEERETRLIIPPKFIHEKGMKYRVSNKAVIPYYEVQFQPSVIKSITLGPKNTSREEIIAQLVKEYIPGAQIHKSQLTYR